MTLDARSEPSNSSTLAPEAQILPLNEPMMDVPCITTERVEPQWFLIISLRYRLRLSWELSTNASAKRRGSLPMSEAFIHLSVGSSSAKNPFLRYPSSSSSARMRRISAILHPVSRNDARRSAVNDPKPSKCLRATSLRASMRPIPLSLIST